MAEISIQYRISVDSTTCEVFDLKLDADSLDMIEEPADTLPSWVRLEYRQCRHCPLVATEHPHCPVASSLVEIVHRFESIVSHDEVDLEVITNERRILQHTTAQRAISALLGLKIATCGCPHTAFFKPMARFHLPLASIDETIFRSVSMYLLAQFFLKEKGEAADFDLQGLRKIYKNMHILNIGITNRFRSATQTDSSLNAIILLDAFTNALPFVIEDNLDDVRYLFEPYYSDFFSQLLNNEREAIELDLD